MEFTDNRSRLVFIDIDREVIGLRLLPKSTWGAEEYRVFGFDFKS